MGWLSGAVIGLSAALAVALPAGAQVPDFMVGGFAIAAVPERVETDRGALVGADGTARFIVREEILPAEATVLAGDGRWMVAGTDLALAERVEPWGDGFHVVTGADGTASTFPDEYYTPADGREPLGFLLHLAGAGYHGILARDLLAVRGEEPAFAALIDRLGEAPSIALHLAGGDGVELDGVVVAAPDRAAARSADGLSVPWGAGRMVFRAHPHRALLIGTTDPADALATLFEAY